VGSCEFAQAFCFSFALFADGVAVGDGSAVIVYFDDPLVVGVTPLFEQLLYRCF